jgi:hypothetical protein
MFQSKGELSKPSFRKKPSNVEKPSEKSNYEILFNLTPKLLFKSREIEKITIELTKLPEDKIKTIQSSKDPKINNVFEHFAFSIQKSISMSFQDYLTGLEYQKEYIVPLSKDTISKMNVLYSTVSSETNLAPEVTLLNDFAIKLYEFSKEHFDDMSYEVFGRV